MLRSASAGASQKSSCGCVAGRPAWMATRAQMRSFSGALPPAAEPLAKICKSWAGGSRCCATSYSVSKHPPQVCTSSGTRHACSKRAQVVWLPSCGLEGSMAAAELLRTHYLCPIEDTAAL